MTSNPDSTLDAYLKGSVRVGRKISDGRYGSFELAFEEQFILSEKTHERMADELAEKVRAKLIEWEAIRP